jgi:gliding motility-associated lipoprotein GldH
MKKISIFLFSILILFSCSNDSKIYSKYKDLSTGGVWDKEDEVFFKVQVKDISSTYNLKFLFRHLSEFAYKDLNIKVTETSPSKRESVSEYSLNLVDENGDYIGEEVMSVIDCETIVESNKKFNEKGVYIYKVEHVMSVSSIGNANELGLTVEKNSQD